MAVSTRSRPQRPRLDDSIVLTILDMANHLLRKGEELAREVGLTTQQWLVLLQIAGDQSFPGADPDRDPTAGVAPSEIADARGVSRANISVLVSCLVKRGLVRQVRDPHDGRSRRLVATSAGLRTIETVDPERRRANRRLLSSLSTDERRALLALLQPCLARLRTARASRARTAKPAQ